MGAETAKQKLDRERREAKAKKVAEAEAHYDAIDAECNKIDEQRRVKFGERKLAFEALVKARTG